MVSNRQPAKAPASLRIGAVSPEHLLFTDVVETLRRRKANTKSMGIAHAHLKNHTQLQEPRFRVPGHLALKETSYLELRLRSMHFI